MILFIDIDTSALVRRYDLTEPGSAHVGEICRPASANDVVLLALTSVELASALRRKLREGAIDQIQHARMWRLFISHRRRQYRVLALDLAIYRRAERLLGRYPLRAYDAVQLAGALALARSLPSRSDVRFCTADRPQALAADGVARATLGRTSKKVGGGLSAALDALLSR